jgi:hypothetical protein
VLCYPFNKLCAYFTLTSDLAFSIIDFTRTGARDQQSSIGIMGFGHLDFFFFELLTDIFAHFFCNI